MNELQSDLARAIAAHVATSPLNRLSEVDGSPIFHEPLVGFADGDDPLFDLYKQVVAPEHLTPREALAASAGGGDGPGVSVVSWVLPIAAATREGNRGMAEGPSLRWYHTRGQGEAFNDDLRRHVVRLLAEWGYAAAAPGLSTTLRTIRGPHGLASVWSERHAAHAAGLGTFGLSDGLITARGIAHRCGSVVVAAGWPPSPRLYTDHHQHCAYFHDGSCGACIERCPAGAIGPAGHDKDLCHRYIHTVLAGWRKRPGYGGEHLACGLCQTGVPCESGVPSP